MELFIKDVNCSDAKKLIDWWGWHNDAWFNLGSSLKRYQYIYIPNTLNRNNKLGNIYRKILESREVPCSIKK